MMSGCKLPGTEELIKLYEERGDDTYWNQFVEPLREDVHWRYSSGFFQRLKQLRPTPS
jgi:hypothetical protein